MSLFKNMFSGSRNDESGSNLQLQADPIDLTTQEKNNLERNEFVSDETPGYKIGHVNYGTGCPIDAIYAFITRDYEEQGFQDALVNADLSYRTAKEQLLRNSLKSLFNQVKMRYTDDIRKIKVQIRTAEEQMISSAVEMLKAQIETYESHMSEIKKMEDNLEKNDASMTLMIESYTRGFLRGISAQSMGFIPKNE